MGQEKFNLLNFYKYLGKLNYQNIKIIFNQLNINISYSCLVKDYQIKIKE
jgi:hypothetical protein